MLRTILIKIGDYLIKEDEFPQSIPAFVLGGGPYDRSKEAARLLKSGKVNELICTGISMNNDYTCVGEEYPEWRITQSGLIHHGVSPDNITTLKEAMTTHEEVHSVFDYCERNNLQEAVIITHKFHTRRVYSQIKIRQRKSKVKIYLHGAPSNYFSEKAWWKSTVGFFTVQNEYVKMFYYLLKHGI